MNDKRDVELNAIGVLKRREIEARLAMRLHARLAEYCQRTVGIRQ